MNIIIQRSEKLITGSVNGKPFSVTFDQEKYDAMTALQNKAEQITTLAELQPIIDEFLPLTEESYKELVETLCPYIFVNKSKNKYYLQFNGVMSTAPLPQIFADKIIKSAEKGIDITPLVKCWARYMRPVKGRLAYNEASAKLFAEYIAAPYTDDNYANELIRDKGFSAEVAKEYATSTQVAITQEGLLVCSKVSREITHKFVLNEKEELESRSRYGVTVDDVTGKVTKNLPDVNEDRLFQPAVMGLGGDAFLCGDVLGHVIKVGYVHQLPTWEQVSMPGFRGLHCGGKRYIKGYQTEGTVTHDIFVDPSHIYGVAGLGYGNDGAMTVKQYFVYGASVGVNRGIYHSSQYAKLTDAEYAGIVAEAVKATQAKQDQLANEAMFTEAIGAI